MFQLGKMSKREFATVSLLSSILSLIGCDPQAWEAERKRLQPENFDKIRAGMTESDVIQILGKPHQTINYALKPLESYFNWRWVNSSGDAMIFSAIFSPEKIVIRTETWRDPQDPKLVS